MSGPEARADAVYRGLAAVEEAERELVNATNAIRAVLDEKEAAEARAAMWEAEYREEQRRTSTAEARVEVELELRKAAYKRIEALEARAAAAEELAEQRALFAHEQAARIGALAKTLNRIVANAESWHGGDAAKGRALYVIAGWAREPLGAQRQEGDT
jgi:DNA transposition AAA+ family ATPase